MQTVKCSEYLVQEVTTPFANAVDALMCFATGLPDAGIAVVVIRKCVTRET